MMPKHRLRQFLIMPSTKKVESRQIAHHVVRPRFDPPRLGDQGRVEVDPDHPVPGAMQVTAVPSGPAAGVQNGRSAWHHRVDQPCLADQVVALGGQHRESVDIALGMTRVTGNDLCPLALAGWKLCTHEPPTGIEPATIRLQGGRSTN